MAKGTNVGLAELSEDAGSVIAGLGWSSASGVGDADVSVLLLDGNGKVRSDEDFYFYNHPAAADGSVQLLGKAPTENGSEDRISLDLTAAPAGVERIVLAASRYGGAAFGDLDDLRLTLSDRAGDALLRFSIEDVGPMSAVIFGELYRRDGTWKFRAVGQGYDSGLSGLATDFGIDVDDDGEGEEASEEAAAGPGGGETGGEADGVGGEPVEFLGPVAAAPGVSRAPRRPRTARKKVTLPPSPVNPLPRTTRGARLGCFPSAPSRATMSARPGRPPYCSPCWHKCRSSDGG